MKLWYCFSPLAIVNDYFMVFVMPKYCSHSHPLHSMEFPLISTSCRTVPTPHDVLQIEERRKEFEEALLLLKGELLASIKLPN